MARLIGTITDTEKVPISKALIVLGTRRTESNKKGNYGFLFISAGTAKISVTKTGYKGITRDIVITPGSNVLNVSLSKESPIVAEIISLSWA